MDRWSCCFVLLVASALCLTGQAAGAFYLKLDDIDLIQILGPPPAPGSPAAEADLQAVVAAMRSRTDEEIKHVQADDQRTVFRFADVMGQNFRSENLPLTTQLFQHVYEDGNPATLAAKNYFKRQRPFVVDPNIEIIVVQAPDFSYPSNHSTFGYEAGILLASMVPEKTAAVFDRAADYARDRVVAGVHFPTDVQAGRIAASVIDNTLLHNAHFVTDFVHAKSEVRAALGFKAASGQ